MEERNGREEAWSIAPPDVVVVAVVVAAKKSKKKKEKERILGSFLQNDPNEHTLSRSVVVLKLPHPDISRLP